MSPFQGSDCHFLVLGDHEAGGGILLSVDSEVQVLNVQISPKKGFLMHLCGSKRSLTV